MGWGALRVWNDDLIAAGTGFPAHPHADMEIITYVRSGAITHEDSLGNRGRTQAGDVQVMSAGSGIVHSEFNLETSDAHIFQIWIQPRSRGGAPRWAAQPFPKADRSGRLVTLASGHAGDVGALEIRADARVLGATLKPGQSLHYDLAAGRKAYLTSAVGSVDVCGVRIGPRDGAAIVDVDRLRIAALDKAEIVLVDAV